jgi:hypothetical protein
MGIQVMVVVERAGGHRVLDFILPSWLHEQAMRFVEQRGGPPARLAPFARLDWTAYEEDATYTPCSAEHLTAAVAHAISALEAHGEEFRPAPDTWTVDDVLGWYRKLLAELTPLDPDAILYVDAC